MIIKEKNENWNLKNRKSKIVRITMCMRVCVFVSVCVSVWVCVCVSVCGSSIPRLPLVTHMRFNVVEVSKTWWGHRLTLIIHSYERSTSHKYFILIICVEMLKNVVLSLCPRFSLRLCVLCTISRQNDNKVLFLDVSFHCFSRKIIQHYTNDDLFNVAFHHFNGEWKAYKLKWKHFKAMFSKLSFNPGDR